LRQSAKALFQRNMILSVPWNKTFGALIHARNSL
jgi:hypothetical protein